LKNEGNVRASEQGKKTPRDEKKKRVPAGESSGDVNKNRDPPPGSLPYEKTVPCSEKAHVVAMAPQTRARPR